MIGGNPIRCLANIQSADDAAIDLGRKLAQTDFNGTGLKVVLIECERNSAAIRIVDAGISVLWNEISEVEPGIYSCTTNKLSIKITKCAAVGKYHVREQYQDFRV